MTDRRASKKEDRAAHSSWKQNKESGSWEMPSDPFNFQPPGGASTAIRFQPASTAGYSWQSGSSKTPWNIFNSQPFGGALTAFSFQPASTAVDHGARLATSGAPERSAEEEKCFWKHFLDQKEEKVPEVGATFASGMSVLECAPSTHRFKRRQNRPAEPRKFFDTLRKETALLSTSLPGGIAVKSFQDRMDIFSALVEGPSRTPYEDGLFLFDLQLPSSYPAAPPLVHYLSQCSGCLNPNLYEDGKVCVSLLGTWSGHGTERWTSKSNLMQVLVSIQGLILVPEPYYNEPGCEDHRSRRESRNYNESALIRTVQSMTRILQTAPAQRVFGQEIWQHFSASGWRLVRRLERWLELHKSAETRHKSRSLSGRGCGGGDYPDVGFPLFPLSDPRSVHMALSQYRAALLSAGIPEDNEGDKHGVMKTTAHTVDGGAMGWRPTATRNRMNELSSTSRHCRHAGATAATFVGPSSYSLAEDTGKYQAETPPSSYQTPPPGQMLWQRHHGSVGDGQQQHLNMQPSSQQWTSSASSQKQAGP